MKTIACVALILCFGLSCIAMARGGGGAGGGAGAAGTGGGGLSVYSYPTYYRYRAYYHHHRQARRFARNNHDKSGFLKEKTVGYGMATRETKAEHYHFRQTTGTEEQTHPSDRTSPEAFIEQIPRDKTGTLSPGTPLLGLDLRSPSTWALYSEMLPFIFSEESAPTSDGISVPRLRENEAGM
jgi:hypothetical protein